MPAFGVVMHVNMCMLYGLKRARPRGAPDDAGLWSGHACEHVHALRRWQYVHMRGRSACTLAGVVKPSSEARGIMAWDGARTALRQVRMYGTMLSSYSKLTSTSESSAAS